MRNPVGHLLPHRFRNDGAQLRPSSQIECQVLRKLHQLFIGCPNGPQHPLSTAGQGKLHGHKLGRRWAVCRTRSSGLLHGLRAQRLGCRGHSE